MWHLALYPLNTFFSQLPNPKINSHHHIFLLNSSPSPAYRITLHTNTPRNILHSITTAKLSIPPRDCKKTPPFHNMSNRWNRDNNRYHDRDERRTDPRAPSRWDKDASVFENENSMSSRDRNRNYGQGQNDYYSAHHQNSGVPPPPGAHGYDDGYNQPPAPKPSGPGFGSIAEQMLLKKAKDEEERRKKQEYDAMTEEERLEKVLGFSSFGSTKGKHVQGANPYFSRVLKKRKFAQYLNKQKRGPIKKKDNNSNSTTASKWTTRGKTFLSFTCVILFRYSNNNITIILFYFVLKKHLLGTSSSLHRTSQIL